MGLFDKSNPLVKALIWPDVPSSTPLSTGGGAGPLYSFSDETSAAGITDGQVRVNNATPASITAVYVAKTDAAGVDRGADLALFSAGGYLTLGDFTLKITSCADSGTYYTLTGTYLSGVMPGDGSEIRVTIAPSDVGAEYVLDPSIVNVSGAGEPGVDGVYLQAGWHAGRRWYAKDGGVITDRATTSDSIYFGGPSFGWRMNRDGWGIEYLTSDDPPNPWSGMWVSNGYPDPAPTVEQGYNTLEGSLASRYPSPMWMYIEGRITQAGTSDPVITILRDDFNIGDPAYFSVGNYRISDISGIGNPDLCSTWFGDNGLGTGTLSIFMSSGKLQFQTRDLTGTLTNGLVTDTYFKLSVRVNDPV